MNTLTMRHINLKQIIGIAGVGIAFTFSGCEDPEFATPAPNINAITLSSNFLFVNASPNAPSLDLAVNGLKVGESVTGGNGQAAYTVVPLTATFFGGGSTTAGANTSLRARASAGTIGGALEGNDLIYRAGNANTNNFVASTGSRYTLLALDSITRPKPIRTLNASNFADTTFFNPLTGAYISRVEKAALPAAQRAQVVPIGTVPLGSSDPGGIRFLLLTDALNASPGTNNAAIRLINASPNAGNVTVKLKATTDITLGTNVPYILSFPGFTPSVGSRTTTVAFTARTIATAGTPINYNIEVTSGSGVFTVNNVTFTVGKNYTIFVTGLKGALSAGVVQH